MSQAEKIPTALAEDLVTCPQEYVVNAGDCLSRVAKKHCGSARLYREIVCMTNQMHEVDNSFAKITNPSRIRAGWKLCLPASTEDIAK